MCFNDPEYLLQQKQQMHELEIALMHLTPRQRLIIEGQYFTEPKITGKILAQELNISKSRVHQIKRFSLRKLNKLLRSSP